MADEKYVPVGAFASTLKALLENILNLNVSVMVLRAALMQQGSLPVPSDELVRLHRYFHDEYPQFQSARKAIDRLTVDKPDELLEILKNFEGPIQ